MSGRKAVAALCLLSLIWAYNWIMLKEGLRFADPFDFAALRSQPPAGAHGAKGFIGLIGQLHALHTAGADQDVPVAARGMAEQIEVAPPQPYELVDKGHGVALCGEAAEG
jgi:hypothetical protein